MTEIIVHNTNEVLRLANFLGVGITVSVDGTKATVHQMKEGSWNHVEVPASKINQLFKIRDTAIADCLNVLGV